MFAIIWLNEASKTGHFRGYEQQKSLCRGALAEVTRDSPHFFALASDKFSSFRSRAISLVSGIFRYPKVGPFTHKVIVWEAYHKGGPHWNHH